MKKTAISALALAAALSAGVAQAQTSAPGATGAPAAATAPAPGGFVSSQGMNQFRASKFVGLSVYGTDNQKIGEINELLLDGSGNVQAAVIGVGGFLGMGEKNVAVPFSSLAWMNTKPGTATAANSGGSSTSTTTTTGSATTANPAQTAAENGYPDHGVLRMSKADLQNAPAFAWYGQKK